MRVQIGRKLIPRYFRSLFDDGVTDCYIVPRMTKESYCGSVIMAECEMASLVSTHTKPFYCIVSADGRLTLDFTFEEQMRIKNWHFLIRGYYYNDLIVISIFIIIISAHEMIPKAFCQTALTNEGPTGVSDICRSVTRCGLSSATLNFLKLCNIMEPMQELFTFHKVTRFDKKIENSY